MARFLASLLYNLHSNFVAIPPLLFFVLRLRHTVVLCHKKGKRFPPDTSRNRSSKQKVKTILLVLSRQGEKYVQEAKLRKPWIKITTELIGGLQELQQAAKKYVNSQQTFGAVVLAPRHGSPPGAYVQWGESNPQTDTHKNLYAIKGLSSHVRLGTCCQGLYLETFFSNPRLS